MPSTAGKSGWGKLRWIGLRIGFWSLVILIAIVMFQRKLIYHPTKSPRLLAAESGLRRGTVHDISLKTDDDLLLHGWHFLPQGKIAVSDKECDRQLKQTRWLVLYFPGNAGNRKSRAFDCDPFTKNGMHVFLFDYRGYGDNPGSPSEDELTADATTLWNYAINERKVSPGRILIFGESLGGGVATRLSAEMCKAGTPPGGLILRATFSSLIDVGKHHYPWLPVGWLLRDRFLSVENIPAVTCPILQIHGSADRIVPIALGRKLFAAAPNRSASGVHKRFVELRRVGHNDIPVTVFRESVRTFLQTLRSPR
ncbi:MAG: alpha/beta hydrolase [Planctomycetes bacterium]|nr:alpha/beta hydrolase [Planctomycetota bacterium]